ncbi:E4 SUMO-protein ligase PIAL2-like isoform X4 [Canna indica]|uniref:E4 SUMO-protein ligase PIAL2-like isoform X4 n=1 Tax=Canna indica TaxID=4628 RepID=A0AAQ3Q6I2_9LILI|nr:E4 SUMO-protein ligase PIAL2-like isoform X4 [Canna indica]
MSTSDTIVDTAQDTISKIMPRFYPQLHFCRLICSFEAKPGYDILLADFDIQKNNPPNEKICLLVVQTDNLETSSCIISPQNVSFLVNGKGVEKRTNVWMDTGPQFPTNISKMLKYGTNIIQAIGYFSGNYIIAIAFMSMAANPYTPWPEDYVHPVCENPVLDSDIIEGPSKIALTCPISFKRIRIPVKGHLCKHHQCFDYDNFMEMNSRKPSWRCPCCNTPTSCIDLRMDQKMVKILEEVAEHVTDIVILADGSWKVFEYGEHIKQMDDRQSGPQEAVMEDVRGTSADVMDLTIEKDCASDTANYPEVMLPNITADTAENSNYEIEDNKPIMENECSPIPLYASEASVVSTMCAQAVSSHLENAISYSNLSSTSCSLSDTSVCADTNALGTLESLVPSVLLNPVETDVVSPALNQGHAGYELPQATMNFQQVSIVPSVLNPIRTEFVFPAPNQRPAGFEIPQTTVNSLQAWLVPNVALNPIQNDALSSAFNQGPAGSEFPQTTLNFQQLPQVAHLTENMQLQSFHVTPSVTTNEARRHTIPRHVSRTPIAIQALPAQTQMPRSLQRMQTALASSINSEVQTSGLSRTSNVAPASIQQHHRHGYSSLLHVVGLSTPSMTSTREPQDQTRGVGVYRTAYSPSDYQYPHQFLSQRSHHLRTPSSTSQHSHALSSQIQQASHSPANTAAKGTSHSISSAQGAAQATTCETLAARIPSSARMSSIPTFGDASGPVLSSLSNTLAELPNEQNWRPTGRMRGSLTGSDYQAVLNRYIYNSQPAQSSQVQPFSANAPLSIYNTHHSQASMVQQANMGITEAGNQYTGLYQ